MKATITLSQQEIKDAIMEILKAKGFGEVKNPKLNITPGSRDGTESYPASVEFTCEVDVSRKSNTRGELKFTSDTK